MIRALFTDEALKSLHSSGTQMRDLGKAGMRLAAEMAKIDAEGPLPVAAVRQLAVAGSLAVAELAKTTRGQDPVVAVANEVHDRIKMQVEAIPASGTNNTLTSTSKALADGMKIVFAIQEAADPFARREALLNVAVTAGLVLNTQRPTLKDITTVVPYAVDSPNFMRRGVYALKPEEGVPVTPAQPLRIMAAIRTITAPRPQPGRAR